MYIDPLSLEKTIHELVNRERKEHRICDLSFDPGMALVARGHSEDMVARAYMCHVTPEGKGPQERGAEKGVTILAENIAGDGEDPNNANNQLNIAQRVVDGWMNSPGHRQNILTEPFIREGIGVGISWDGLVYITQVFS